MCLPEKDPVSNRKASVIADYQHIRGQWPHCCRQKERILKEDRETADWEIGKDLVVSLSLLRKRLLQRGGEGSEAPLDYHLSIIIRGGKAFPSLCEFPLKFPHTKSLPYSESPTPEWEWTANEWTAGIRLPLTHWAVSLTDKWENTAVTVLTNGATFPSENERVL